MWLHIAIFFGVVYTNFLLEIYMYICKWLITIKAYCIQLYKICLNVNNKVYVNDKIKKT